MIALQLVTFLFAVAMRAVQVRASRKFAERLLLVRTPLDPIALAAVLACFALAIPVFALVSNAELISTRHDGPFMLFTALLSVGLLLLGHVVGMKVTEHRAIGSITLLEDDWLRVRFGAKETNFHVITARVMRTYGTWDHGVLRYELSDGLITLAFMGQVPMERSNALGGPVFDRAGTLIYGDTMPLYGWLVPVLTRE